MIGYASVEVQVEADFDRARRRAFVGRIVARLHGDRGWLLAFDETRKCGGHTTGFVWA